jgi:peptidoglycan/LPS O-acetylase OafA/YrhL
VPPTPTGHAARPRPRLPAALAAAVVPAYLFPAVTTALNALLVPDPDLAARLAAAAWTTIAIPSAVAAGLVTLWAHRRDPPPRRSAGTTARAVAGAALACLAVSAAACAVLVGHGALPPSALQFTLASAALGGGLAGRRWARGRPTRPSGARRTHPLGGTS